MSPKLEKVSSVSLPTAVLGASCTDDGRIAVAACMDGVYLVDLSADSSRKISEHNSYASSAAFLPKHNAIVSAGYDGVLKWYDQSSLAVIRERSLHNFWSWDMAVSPDQSMIASVTGQYLAGGYKYEPQSESEPSVRIVSAATGEILHNLPHVPSVQAVAFSPDSQFVAAGNLMGEVRIWNAATGELVANWTTDGFTSWGIVKSHSYLGGIFSMKFTTDGKELLLAGMGPMRDPMAGNGRQRWQKWTWQESTARMVDETHKGESGEGLMEALAVHPDGKQFVMGGRLRGGDWDTALFDLASGKRTGQLKTGLRVTETLFTADGDRMIVAGTFGQPKKKEKDGRFRDFGRIDTYRLS